MESMNISARFATMCVCAEVFFCSVQGAGAMFVFPFVLCPLGPRAMDI